jgi:membrane protein DedA with SNARE-associated domain
MAGALGIGAVRAAIAMTLASGLWYGIVCVLAFRAGANADALLARIAEQQRALGIVAVVIVVLVATVVWWRWRRSRRMPRSRDS